MKNSDVFVRSITFRKYENAMAASREMAPYLGTVDSNGTVDTEAFVEEMVDEDGCTESAESISRVIKCHDEAVKACLGDQVMKVYTGDGSLVSPFIYGSLDAPDASVGPDNAVEPQIRLGADLRDAAADIIPTEDRSTIGELGGVTISDVLTEGVDYGVVKGTLPFIVTGNGFKPDATSTVTMALANVKTLVLTPATVVSCDSTQRIKAKMPAALAKGAYKIIVTVTSGSGAEAREWTATKNVTVLAADPTPLKRITLTDFTADREGGSWYVTGTNLDGATNWRTEGSSECFDAVVSQGEQQVTATFSRGVGTETAFIAGWAGSLPTTGTLTLTVTPNPAKTDFDQTPVTIEES